MDFSDSSSGTGSGPRVVFIFNSRRIAVGTVPYLTGTVPYLSIVYRVFSAIIFKTKICCRSLVRRTNTIYNTARYCTVDYGASQEQQNTRGIDK